MSIFIGNSEIKNAYIGTTPVKEVYVGTTKVRPSGYNPPSGCVAYFPFADDTLDKVGGRTFTITKSGISLTTTSGVKALYNNGNGRSNINIGFRTSDVTSMMFWYKHVSGRDAAVLGVRSTTGGDCDRIVYDRPYSPYGYAYSRYPGTYILPGNGFPQSWLCFGIIETSSGSTMYVNGTNVGTVSGAEAFSNLTGNVGILCRNDNGSYVRPICGYLSKLAFFNREITEAEYLSFYNDTKADYGL